MRKFMLFLAGVFVASAALAEGVPDPGLQNNINPQPPTRKPLQNRPVVKDIDSFDEKIADLPTGDLRLKHLDAGEVVEKLVYDITVNRLPAGKAEFELKRQEKYGKTDNQVPVYTASLMTRANRAMSLMYDVSDSAHSIFDAKGGFARAFTMDRKEGKSKVAERINFDYNKETMAAAYERPKLGADAQVKWVSTSIKLPGKVLDPLSAVYFMRLKELNLEDIVPGKAKPAITLPVCSDRSVWNTNLFAIGIDHPDVGSYKNRKCIVFEVDAPFRGLFEHVGKIRIWIDAKSGVAVKMTAEIPIGPAEAILDADHSTNLPEDFTNPTAR